MDVSQHAPERVYTIQNGDSEKREVKPPKFPKNIQPPMGKKGTRLFAYRTMAALLEKDIKSGKWVDDWERLPTGSWFLKTPDGKETWTVTITEKEAMDPRVLSAFEKAFGKHKNRFEAALVFARLNPQYKKDFASMPKETQIRMLQMPNKKQAGFLKGDFTLDQYIEENALTPEDRQARKCAREEAERAARIREIQAEQRRKDVDNFDLWGRLGADRIPITAFEHMKVPGLDFPKYGEIKIAMKFGQGDSRHMEQTLDNMTTDCLTFPTPIKRILYYMYTIAAVRRWVNDLPLAADMDTQAAPGLHTLIIVRRLDPVLYFQALYKSKRERGILWFTNWPFDEYKINAETVMYVYRHFPTTFEVRLEKDWVPEFDEETKLVRMVKRTIAIQEW